MCCKIKGPSRDLHSILYQCGHAVQLWSMFWSIMLYTNFDVVTEFSCEKFLKKQNRRFLDCTITVETCLKVLFESNFSYVFDIYRCNLGRKSWNGEIEEELVTRYGYDREHLWLIRQSNRLCGGGDKITQLPVCWAFFV